MQDLKFVGLKSHDCHILMQQLLPVTIRGILPKNVRQTITRLCAFFSSICNKVIDPLKLDELQAEIVIILCQLEMSFPPSFFDIMVHLLVHLVREIKFCGPVYLRWMYPIERYMKILTYLLLQLDGLSTLDVCMVLDQESAYANFLVPPLVSLHAVMVLIMNKE